MSYYPQNTRPVTLDYAETRDVSLPKFFNLVYAWMCVGLAVTAVVGYACSSTGLIVKNPLIAVAAMLGAFALSYATQTVAMRISAGLGLTMFIGYAALIGVMISYVFLRYDLETLGGAFFVTGGVFAGTSIVGFVTKKDLSGIGGIAVMCAWGLFFGSLFNLFFASEALSWFITYAVLAVFIVITAYETQQLKNIALELAGNQTMLQRAAVVGSLVLYISFMNLFLSILRILGSRK